MGSRASLKSPEKQFVKLKSGYYEIWIFHFVFKTLENKTIAKLHDLKRLTFKDTKRFKAPRNTLEKFRHFRQTSPTPPPPRGVVVARKHTAENKTGFWLGIYFLDCSVFFLVTSQSMYSQYQSQHNKSDHCM